MLPLGVNAPKSAGTCDQGRRIQNAPFDTNLWENSMSGTIRRFVVGVGLAAPMFGVGSSVLAKRAYARSIDSCSCTDYCKDGDHWCEELICGDGTHYDCQGFIKNPDQS